MSNPDHTAVHATHCCPLFGCKYGDEDCPVALKQVEAVYACESCVCDKMSPKPDVEAWWASLPIETKRSLWRFNMGL